MSFCTNCGSSLSEGVKFCSSCGTANNERPHEKAPSADKKVPVQQKNKSGIFKRIAVFIAISFVILLAAVFYIQHKAQERFEAASNQLRCDTENDGEACLLYANYTSAYDGREHYLDKACMLIPKTDNPERLANICADAGNFEAACNLKHAKSCYDDGEYRVKQFLETRGNKPRIDEQALRIENALKTVRNSCELGYSEGCDLYVRSIFHSKYHYLNLGQISEHAAQACEAGYQTSCYFIEKGFFAAYGDIGKLQNNAPLDYIRRIPRSFPDGVFDLNLSGRCTAIVNISKYGTLERIIDLSCNHNDFKKMMEDELTGSTFFPLLLDGRPARRINENITEEYKIVDDNGRLFPLE